MSEDKDKNSEIFDLETADQQGEPQAAKTDEDPVKKLQAEVERLTKEQLYLRAEYDNYRRQAIKERSELVKYAGERLARDLLNVLDIFDTALQVPASPEQFENFRQGMTMTAHEFRQVLERHGIRAVDVDRQAFDPNLVEALASEAHPEIEQGKIVRTFRKAYKYHDKVLRPGQVIVSSGAPKSSDVN